MKFSHSLIFSVVPEWQSHYLAYDSLKSAIYRFEKEAVQARGASEGDLESSALLGRENGLEDGPEDAESNPTDRLFSRLLDKELAKVVDFYAFKERELLSELQLLKQDIERTEHDEAFTSEGPDAEDDDDDDSDDEDASKRRSKLFKAAAKLGLTSIGGTPRRRRRGISTRRRGLSIGSTVSEEGPQGENDAPRNGTTGGSDAAARRRSSGDSAPPTRGELVAATDADVEEAMQFARGPSRSTAKAVTSTPVRPAMVPQASRFSLNRTPRRSRAWSHSAHSASEDLDASMRLSVAPSIWSINNDYVVDIAVLYKRRMTGLFNDLSELKSYVTLNQTGFRKILKKYDKITDSSLKDRYMANVVDKAFPFEASTQERLGAAVRQLVPMYARIVTRGDEEMALKQLKTHLREHVVWERNTIWREMIGRERRGWGSQEASGLDKPRIDHSNEDDKPIGVTIPAAGRIRLPKWFTQRLFFGVIALALLTGLTRVQAFDRPEERNCLALLAFATVMWAAEVIPLFVTSLAVPFLVVILRVIRVNDQRLSAPDATKYIFAAMLSPTIMLLIGGFTLAAALSKHNIDKVVAAKVLSLAGTRPSTVLLAYMGVACFASMWISNVAAPVLCYSLIQPILRTLPPKSTFSKSLILGIALASNVGGQSSPISSPQNLIALEYMDPPLGWLSWFAVAIPVSSLTVVLMWLLLLWSYGSGRGTIINPVRPSRDPFSGTQWFVVGIAAVTIILWCVEHQIQDIVGDMGIIALVPLIVFFGSGLLRKSDFDNFPWSIVFLAMGGIALGKAVLASGLLADVDDGIERVVQGLDIWPILAVFATVTLVIATLISHTVASVLLVPVAAQIGSALETPHPRLLILTTALMTAINLEDDVGQRYLAVSDFLKNGIPASIVATLIVITLGYVLMLGIGL